MFYYEDMKSDVTLSLGFDNYTCKCWTGVSPIRIEDKEVLILTTQCYDEGLHDFINTCGKFSIDFKTSVKDKNFEENHSLTNSLNDMRLIFHKSEFGCESITNHTFVFGNNKVTEQDAINVLNIEMKEEIINEVCKKIIKHMGR